MHQRWQLLAAITMLSTLARGTQFQAVGSVPAAEEPIRIMVVGTFHMGATGDAMNPAVADVLEPNRQKEIKALVDELARFRPTAIALEALPGASMQAQYERYIAGDLDLGADERHQIGFRLANELGHAAVHSIDHDATVEVLDVLAWAHANGLQETASNIMSEYQKITTVWNAAMKQSMKDIYRSFNSDEIDKANHEIFMSFLRIGTAEQPVGVEALARWHERNLYIAANVLRLAKPGDRVFVLIGANHRKLLIEFLERSPGVEIVDSESFLDDMR